MPERTCTADESRERMQLLCATSYDITPQRSSREVSAGIVRGERPGSGRSGSFSSQGLDIRFDDPPLARGGRSLSKSYYNK